MKRVCQNPYCKKEFEARPADVARGWAQCCCKACAAWKREKAKGMGSGWLNSKGERTYVPTAQSENDRIFEAGMDSQELAERGY